ncbi:MAG: UdgX family uracil-DNA binding protein [Acidobacteria bacterium]|nr:UdgX family uracil-DNA binding protein [Acidobacteriota bacterium]
MRGETKHYVPVSALIPARPTLSTLTRAASGCKGCDLYLKATQTVFGEGPAGARVMLVGEQPGDREDLAGKPFVGPAGRVLDEALTEAGIDRSDVYVTNVVKHFRWEGAARGKRRIHKKPRSWEIRACRPWLDAELAIVQPEVLVCLGASAAQALLGRNFSVTRQRGELVDSPLAPEVIATVHPSSILRAPDAETRRFEMTKFVDDLRKVAGVLASARRAA